MIKTQVEAAELCMIIKALRNEFYKISVNEKNAEKIKNICEKLEYYTSELVRLVDNKEALENE